MKEQGFGPVQWLPGETLDWHSGLFVYLVYLFACSEEATQPYHASCELSLLPSAPALRP